MVEAVLFDMDGILYDSEKFYIHGTYTWMEELGFKGKEKDLFPIIGTTMEGTYQILYQLLDGKYTIEQLDEINTDYFYRRNPIQYREIMFDDILDGLNKLKEMNIVMAVCSSSPKKTIVDSLEEMGITSYFQFIISGEEIAHPKPSPDIYVAAMHALQKNVEQCVVYEDSTMGIMAGVNAKIFTVARKDDRFSQDQSMANMMVENLKELVEWIGKERQHARSN